MALALQVRIFREQRLAERLQRLVVVLHFVGGRPGVELNPVALPGPGIFLERFLEMLVGLGKFLLLVEFEAGRGRADLPNEQEENRRRDRVGGTPAVASVFLIIGDGTAPVPPVVPTPARAGDR